MKKNHVFGIEHFVCISSACAGDARFVGGRMGGLSECLSFGLVTMKSYLPEFEIYLTQTTGRGFCRALHTVSSFVILINQYIFIILLRHLCKNI